MGIPNLIVGCKINIILKANIYAKFSIFFFIGDLFVTALIERPKRRTVLLIWLIVSQLLALGSFLIWALVAGLSVMAFDMGSTPEARAFVIAVWSYPLFPIAISIGAWVAFALRRNLLAALLSGLTFAPPVLFYIFLWITSLIGP